MRLQHGAVMGGNTRLDVWDMLIGVVAFGLTAVSLEVLGLSFCWVTMAAGLALSSGCILTRHRILPPTPRPPRDVSVRSVFIAILALGGGLAALMVVLALGYNLMHYPSSRSGVSWLTIIGLFAGGAAALAVGKILVRRR